VGALSQWVTHQIMVIFYFIGAIVFDIVNADISTPIYAKALVDLLNIYALDRMGGGTELSSYVKENLAQMLSTRSNVRVIFALTDGKPIGMIICMEGFSTFSCQPLLNIHDVIVKPEYRGQGVSKMMLAKAEEIAIELGCCKLTLEVLQNNTAARTAYTKFGFAGYQLDPLMGDALFLQKKLSA
jgi:ribosomal protein S18 acetylase RimI-like enzyme